MFCWAARGVGVLLPPPGYRIEHDAKRGRGKVVGGVAHGVKGRAASTSMMFGREESNEKANVSVFAIYRPVVRVV